MWSRAPLRARWISSVSSSPTTEKTFGNTPTAINGKEFQCGGDIREFLELVKEEQSLSWQKSLARVQTGNILDDLVRLIAVGCDELVLGLLYEIDIDHIFVAALGKTLDRLCLVNRPIKAGLSQRNVTSRLLFPLIFVNQSQHPVMGLKLNKGHDRIFYSAIGPG